MKKLIEEAKRIHAQAFEELGRGEKLNNEILVRDANLFFKIEGVSLFRKRFSFSKKRV